MFTDDHFVRVTATNTKLETKHRRLVRKHITENQRNKYLQVGRRGKISSTFSWRIGPAPGKSAKSSEDKGRSSSELRTPGITSTFHYSPPLTSQGALTGNSHDPFACLPVTIRGSVDPSRTLTYIYQGWTPAIERESNARPGDVVHPVLDELLPMALHNPALFSAVLTDLQYWHDLESSAQDSSSLLEYHGQAITNIRSNLATHATGGLFVDDATILAMTFLMGFASWGRDESSEIAHRVALQRVIASRGGIGAMTPFVRSMVLHHSFWLQQDRARTPLFDRHEYVSQVQRVERPHLSSTSEISEAWAELPPTFASLLQYWVPSVQLLDVLVRTQRWTASLGRLWSRQATQEDHATCARYDALMILEDVNHLQATSEGPELHNGVVITLDDNATNLILLVLVLYLLNTMYKKIAQSRPIYHNARNGASGLLMRWLQAGHSILPSSTLEQNLVLWCCMVVIDSYRQDNNRIDSPGSELMAALYDRWPTATSWQFSKQRLQEGFCYGATLRAWKICWDEEVLIHFNYVNTFGSTV